MFINDDGSWSWYRPDPPMTLQEILDAMGYEPEEAEEIIEQLKNDADSAESIEIRQDVMDYMIENNVTVNVISNKYNPATGEVLIVEQPIKKALGDVFNEGKNPDKELPGWIQFGSNGEIYVVDRADRTNCNEGSGARMDPPSSINGIALNPLAGYHNHPGGLSIPSFYPSSDLLLADGTDGAPYPSPVEVIIYGVDDNGNAKVSVSNLSVMYNLENKDPDFTNKKNTHQGLFNIYGSDTKELYEQHYIYIDLMNEYYKKKNNTEQNIYTIHD